MSVHRSKYAAVVVGGGPAGITVGILNVYCFTTLISPGRGKLTRQECQALAVDRRPVQSWTSEPSI